MAGRELRQRFLEAKSGLTKMPKRGTFPRVCKRPQNGSQANKRGTENLVNRKRGITGVTLKWVSGRIREGQLSIGPLGAGWPGRGRPCDCLQLRPDPRTHRNCMAAIPPLHRPSLHLFLLVAPGRGDGVGGELGPAAGADGGLEGPRPRRQGWPEDRLVTFVLHSSQQTPGTRVDPPTPSTELWLDLVSQQPFPQIRGPP